MRLSTRATKNWASTPRTKPRAKQRMQNKEFRQLCAQLGINDNETACELLGPSWRSCQRYWYDELAPPEPLARLLRLAAGIKLTHDQLRKLIKPVL